MKHSCTLSIQFVPSIDRNRTQVKKSQVIDYFTVLENAYSKMVNPLLVFNMDETGLSSRPEKGKIYRCVTHAESTFLPFKIETRDYRHISIVSTISLAGEVITPLTILTRKHWESEIGNETWYNQFKFIYGESGYMNASIMKYYINNILKPHIMKTREIINDLNAHAVLIMDNMSAHVTNDVMNEFASLENFEIVLLPPHSSHILQPLDLSYFGIFKKRYMQYKNARSISSLKEKMSIIAHALHDVSYIDIVMNSWKAGGHIIETVLGDKKIASKNQEKINQLISQFQE